MAKKQAPRVPSVASAPPRRSTLSIVALGVLVVLCTAGVLTYVAAGRNQSVQTPGSAAPAPAAAQSGAEAAQAAPPGPPANAKFGPHKQATLPPLPFSQYPPPRPSEIVAAVYTFAAEHPEVLGYVPCYCGCERGGHRGNDDCFVASRAANGDVTAWEPHGVT